MSKHADQFDVFIRFSLPFLCYSSITCLIHVLRDLLLIKKRLSVSLIFQRNSEGNIIDNGFLAIRSGISFTSMSGRSASSTSTSSMPGLTYLTFVVDIPLPTRIFMMMWDWSYCVYRTALTSTFSPFACSFVNYSSTVSFIIVTIFCTFPLKNADERILRLGP